jgi:hypothetical protein
VDGESGIARAHAVIGPAHKWEEYLRRMEEAGNVERWRPRRS